jgi:hypothetical protein
MEDLLITLAKRVRRKNQAFVYLGSSDSPVTTEMLVTANHMQNSVELMRTVGIIFLDQLVTKVEEARA